MTSSRASSHIAGGPDENGDGGEGVQVQLGRVYLSGGWVVRNAQESRWCQTWPVPKQSADTHFLLKKDRKTASFFFSMYRLLGLKKFGWLLSSRWAEEAQPACVFW